MTCMFGVSVVVCCHNSAKLLPLTLIRLASQQLLEGLPCEVIVVDNASTDGTAALARASWPEHTTIPLRVIHEPQLGLSRARRRGIESAKYEIISFIDDDNRVCPEWCQVAVEIMRQHPEVGACGGYNEPDIDVNPPTWFSDHQSNYAVGRRSENAGDVTGSVGYLWGAGLTVRKSALSDLLSKGFQSSVSDRQGQELNSGGDTELCFALRLAGWRLWYDPRLRLQHYLPAGRLNWTYLRRMTNGFGRASVCLDSYEIALNGINRGMVGQIRCTWLWRVLATVKSLLKSPVKLALSFFLPLEGDADVLVIESHLGRLKELMRKAGMYSSHIKDIQNAKWRNNGTSLLA